MLAGFVMLRRPGIKPGARTRTASVVGAVSILVNDIAAAQGE